MVSSLACIPRSSKIKVWLIGDSTMCEYGADRAPLTGWGMPFAGFFDSTVIIENHAKGGRSTRTFLLENRWQPIVDNISAGDFVFIQFGHNDEAKEEKYKDRYTPVADYKTNLMRFISDTRSKNGIPVLITPVTRLRFDNKGNIQQTHQEYSAAVREVGKNAQVEVIDLDEKSRALLQAMGEADAKLLFMNLDSLEHPHYPAGLKDDTHFNEYGARLFAQLVLKECMALKLDLAERIIKIPTKN